MGELGTRIRIAGGNEVIDEENKKKGDRRKITEKKWK